MQRWLRTSVIVMVVALVASSCDSSAETDPAPSETASTAATASTTTGAPSTTTTVPAPSTATTTTVAEATTTTVAASDLPEGIARVHYANTDEADWVLHVWEDTTESVTWESGLQRSGSDDFGLYWDVGIAEGGAVLGFIVHRGDEKDPGPDQFLDLTAGREVWVVSGDAEVYLTEDEAMAARGPVASGPAEPLADGYARIHYTRPDGEYGGFTLHVWEDTVEEVTWTSGLEITGADDFGAYWDLGLAEEWETVGFIVHRGDEKDPGPDMFLRAADHGREIWLVSGSDAIFTERSTIRSPAGFLAG